MVYEMCTALLSELACAVCTEFLREMACAVCTALLSELANILKILSKKTSFHPYFFDVKLNSLTIYDLYIGNYYMF
jgi:hypothetical protein